MKITFYGAAQNVTGSKHLVETGGLRILLDCGLHQGKRSEARALNSELPFDAKTVDAVILSHAHADHCGMLPVLVRQGFTGKIYATSATAEIAEYIILDSAKIQEQDTIYYNDHLGASGVPIYPLYTTEDAEAVFPHFEPVPYFRISKQWTELNANVRFKLYDAGHILGSSVIVLETTEDGKTKRLAFSGDLGSHNMPILQDPEKITEPVDTLLLECTYGNRLHRPISDAGADLKRIIDDAVSRKRKIIVPTFSLGRTQELIYILHKLTDEGAIPRIPIYIDSPLATKITTVFSRHDEDFDEEAWKDFGKDGESPFDFKNLTYTQSSEESKTLNTLQGPCMIISASGMAEGGRILHHLKNNIEDSNTIILITGYQAKDTLGRKIQEGISPVNILGRPYRVNAEIINLDELSAHADQKGLAQYISDIAGLQTICLVHTEMPQAEEFTKLLKKSHPNTTIITPALRDSIEV
jgi:metallo-beta-lactamase family protein